MTKSTALYPQIHATADGGGIVTHSGLVLAARTAHVCGLAAALTAEMAPWRKPFATHDPAKILLDIAISVIAGGDARADVATVRGRPDVFGPVASNSTVSRLTTELAQDPIRALGAITTARHRVWELAADRAPGHDRSVSSPLIIDLDATLITAHSEKENATPTHSHSRLKLRLQY